MKSKTSFFNKGIILDDLRRFGWIGIAYTLALFFIVPLKILIWHSSDQTRTGMVIGQVIQNIFYLCDTMGQGALVVTVPVLLAIFLFRYMQVKISSDMIHSLPIKRNVLYRSHVFIGILLLIIPVVIIGVISVILNKSLDLSHYYRIYDVIKWSGTTILMNLVFFLTCVFVGMVVCNSVMQGALTYIFLILPAALTVLFIENIRIFLYGFMCYPLDETEKFSPIIRVFQGFQDYNNVKRNISVKEVLIYMIICITLYFVAKLLYNKRKLEVASQAIAFKSWQYVFKYGAAFCSMLVGGMYFQLIYFQLINKNKNWIFFGFLIGFLIEYFVAEMIIRKSVGVINSIKGYGIYAVVMILLFQGIKLDVIGYEKKLPELNKVENVYFSDINVDFNNQNYKINISSDKNYLQSVYELHKQLIEDKTKNKNRNNKEKRYASFIYELKDGSKIKRAYEISYGDYKKNLKPIYESKEYKKVKYPILNIDSSHVEKIEFNPCGNYGKVTTIINPSDIKEGIEVLKQDINSESYEQMDNERKPWANVDFIISNKYAKKYKDLNGTNNYWNGNNAHAEWRKSYKLFEEWLKKKGYAKNLMIYSKDVAYAVVEKVENDKQWEENRRNETFISNNNANHLEITDKNQIETCLEKGKYTNKDKGVKYVIGFYGADKKGIDFECFDEGDVPEFVKNYFNK